MSAYENVVYIFFIFGYAFKSNNNNKKCLAILSDNWYHGEKKDWYDIFNFFW